MPSGVGNPAAVVIAGRHPNRGGIDPMKIAGMPTDNKRTDDDIVERGKAAAARDREARPGYGLVNREVGNRAARTKRVISAKDLIRRHRGHAEYICGGL